MTRPDAPGAVAGVVLAGGRARRLGGRDKGLIRIGGTTLVAGAVRRLGAQAGPLAVSANGDPARYTFLGLPVIADADGERRGPLAGILAGMRWAATLEPAPARIATVAVDTPFLPPDLVARLSDAAAAGAVAVAASGGRTHPVIGLWPVALAGRLAGYLPASDGSVHGFLVDVGCTVVDFDVPEAGPDPFFNVNTEEDLEAAERFAAGSYGFPPPLEPGAGLSRE